MRLIIFDLDHTLLTVNSSYAFGVYLYRQKRFSFFKMIFCLVNYLRHRWGALSMADLHEKIFSCLFRGWEMDCLKHDVDHFLKTQLDAFLSVPVWERLQEAKKRGDYILILSSSPSFLVEAIAEQLDVHEGKGSTYEVDDQGQLAFVSHILDGQAKAEVAQAIAERMNISLASMTVYSDHHLDLPLLKIAGQAIAVSPTRRLKSFCIENGWEIL